MLLLDVNVVVGVHRDDHPAFGAVHPWFIRMLAEDVDFTVPSTVWTSFLRIATNRRVFSVPTSLGAAFTFIDAVSTQPGFRPTAPGPRHLTLVRRLCEEASATGDLVPDAVIGAIAVEHACEVVTLDRDFARFRSVRHRLLLDSA